MHAVGAARSYFVASATITLPVSGMTASGEIALALMLAVTVPIVVPRAWLSVAADGERMWIAAVESSVLADVTWIVVFAPFWLPVSVGAYAASAEAAVATKISPVTRSAAVSEGLRMELLSG